MTFRFDPPRPLLTPEQSQALGERVRRTTERVNELLRRAAPALQRAMRGRR